MKKIFILFLPAFFVLSGCNVGGKSTDYSSNQFIGSGGSTYADFYGQRYTNVGLVAGARVYSFDKDGTGYWKNSDGNNTIASGSFTYSIEEDYATLIITSSGIMGQTTYQENVRFYTFNGKNYCRRISTASYAPEYTGSGYLGFCYVGEYDSSFVAQLKKQDGLCYAGWSDEPYYSFIGPESKEEVNFSISQGTKIIGKRAMCLETESIKTVTMPNSIVAFNASIFSKCDVTYQGTQAEFNAIEKDEQWDVNAGNTVIHCSDGDINLY